MIRIVKWSLLLAFFLPLGHVLQAQSRSKQYEEYIKKYRDIAVEEMERLSAKTSHRTGTRRTQANTGKRIFFRYS